MKSFIEYVENKNKSILAGEIVEHLVWQSLFVNPAITLEAVFAEDFGKENTYRFIEAHNTILEAFGDSNGFWGNLWQGAKGLGQSILGTTAAGVGGGMGALGGGAVGAAKGAFGHSGDPESAATVQGGARDGSATGRGWMQQGWDNMKDAWGQQGQAALVDAYRNSIAALDAYAQAVQGMPQLPQFAMPLQEIKKKLEVLSTKMEKTLAGGDAEKPPVQMPRGAKPPVRTAPPNTGSPPVQMPIGSKPPVRTATGG